MKKKDGGEAKSHYEGQLAVDVYQTATELVIKAPIAGVKLADLTISVTDDVVTIRGERKQDETVSKAEYLSRECYWGAFSRAIILPEGVDKENIKARFKEGILAIHLPLHAKQKKVMLSE